MSQSLGPQREVITFGSIVDRLPKQAFREIPLERLEMWTQPLPLVIAAQDLADLEVVMESPPIVFGNKRIHELLHGAGTIIIVTDPDEAVYLNMARPLILVHDGQWTKLYEQACRIQSSTNWLQLIRETRAQGGETPRRPEAAKGLDPQLHDHILGCGACSAAYSRAAIADTMAGVRDAVSRFMNQEGDDAERAAYGPPYVTGIDVYVYMPGGVQPGEDYRPPMTDDGD